MGAPSFLEPRRSPLPRVSTWRARAWGWVATRSRLRRRRQDAAPRGAPVGTEAKKAGLPQDSLTWPISGQIIHDMIDIIDMIDIRPSSGQIIHVGKAFDCGLVGSFLIAVFVHGMGSVIEQKYQRGRI